MMRRIIVSLTALLLAVSLWADDPWKSKPYTDWSEEVARKILNDSPWAKGTKVDATWRGTSGGSGSGGSSGVGSSGARGRVGSATSSGAHSRLDSTTHSEKSQVWHWNLR